MKKMELSQNKMALVDDMDYEWLSQWKWSYKKGRHTGYAVRCNSKDENKTSTVYMHREIALRTFGEINDNLVDHLDGNGINNQRCNLRITSLSNNNQNRTIKNHLGICFHERAGKWQAKISKDNKAYHLGLFDSEKEALRAYDEKARELYGFHAKTNFNTTLKTKEIVKMLVDKKIAIELIKKEIDWCQVNFGITGRGEEFESGFIKGLDQALYLLNPPDSRIMKNEWKRE